MTGTPAGRQTLPPTTKKMLRRRRRAALLAFFGVAVAVLAVGQVTRRAEAPRVTTVVPVATALPPAMRPGNGPAGPTPASALSGPEPALTPAVVQQPPTDATDAAPSRPVDSFGSFTFASGYGPVLGRHGTVRRFKVAVERSLGKGGVGDFAEEIDRTLGDRRSWVASREFRLQRVPASAASEFTVYLASAAGSERMCAAGGLATDGFTSCRLPGQVIINEDRWRVGVPDYDAPLATYRAYTINHEVGHQLGHGHEACPKKNHAAPVMQQQTYGLQGCIANAWPYLDGERYAGAATS